MRILSHQDRLEARHSRDSAELPKSILLSHREELDRLGRIERCQPDQHIDVSVFLDLLSRELPNSLIDHRRRKVGGLHSQILHDAIHS
jgi:hypothetical protein